MKTIISCLTIVAALAIQGCRAPNANPPSPQAATGYVDFYTDNSQELAWEIKLLDKPDGQPTTVFSEFKPVAGTTLRVQAPPGNQQFEVWFRNRVTEGPQGVAVAVENGKVTPVHVTLVPSSSATIKDKVYGFRPSAKGYGRGTKVTSQDADVYRIEAVAESPQAYKVKEQMPYFAQP